MNRLPVPYGAVKVAIGLVAATHQDPVAAIQHAAELARSRADHDRRWAVLVDLLDECARDSAVVRVA